MKYALQFSGGKDSLACLYLLRDKWDETAVLWVNTGAAYPETLEQMEGIRKLVPHFVEVKTNQAEWIEHNGLPSDIVPIVNTRFHETYGKPETPFIQPWAQCCSMNLWQPLQQAVVESGAKIIVRGQKKSDLMRAKVDSGHTENGYTYWFPIENWTDDDVIQYLHDNHIKLPDYYDFSDTSLDCWSCTAFVHERHRELSTMKEHHPELWVQVKPRFEAIAKAVRNEAAHIERIL